MKMPLFEQSAGALRALLATPTVDGMEIAQADLYTIGLQSGPVLKYCSGDIDVGYNPGSGFLTWTSKQVRIDDPTNKALAHYKTGTDTDTWQAMLWPRSADEFTGAQYPDQIGSTPWIAAARAGFLDNATVEVDRAYWVADLSSPPAPGTLVPVGVYPIFVGHMAAVDVVRTGVVINANTWVDLLTLQMPRNLFQFPCRYTLFGPGCNNAGSLPQSSFAKTGTIVSSSGNTITATVSAPSGSGTFQLGQIRMTSGLNSGFARLIRSYVPGSPATLTLKVPFYFALEPGDTFTAYPGCNKNYGTGGCTSFGNTANFGGQDRTPVPELAV